MSERVRFTHDVEHSDAASTRFTARVVDDQLPEIGVDAWATTVTELPEVGRLIVRVTLQGRETSYLELTDGSPCLVSLMNGWANVQVAAADRTGVQRCLAQLRGALPVPDPSSAHEVTVTFWTYGPHGPMPSFRTIAVPGWTEISGNYAAETRGELAALMTGFEPSHGGQLVLWHGKAGTGKTFALRALAWEWRSWCELHYIVDPDTFFGAQADYLMNVLVHEPLTFGWAMEQVEGAGGIVPAVVGAEDETRGKPWRLLVLEDTGELLTPDAKAIIGQGLSRFLNVVDGLIGQGLRVLVLVTTNEPLKSLHPAVARPGRCAANVLFGPLSESEASAWLSEHEADGEMVGAQTLASLYARVAGRPEEATASLGFGD